MGRKLVIGDIHGGLKALIQAFERANVSGDDSLIFLGDYVDGWSESAQVVDLVMSLSGNQDCVFIKGNHDEWCEEWLRTGKPNTEWLFHGGQATIESYDNVSDESRRKHLIFFEKMKMYVVDDHNRLFIHAGFTSMHGPQKEFYSSNYGWDRTLWESALSLDPNLKPDDLYYPKRFTIYKEIFIGHTPVTRIG